MATIEEDVKTCQGCGASIYPEQLQRHIADLWNGKLLCVHCLAEARPKSPAGPPKPAAGGGIQLADWEEPPAVKSGTGQSPPTATATAGISHEAAVHHKTSFRRPLLTGSANATRCRTFHCKLSDAAMAYLNDQVNDWVDSQDGVEVKFATTAIGVVEGKHSDPHLIVTIFY
jgi:hypothetical protein